MSIKSSITASAILAVYLAGCAGPEQAAESVTHQSVITDCSSLPTVSGIDPTKELVIEDLSVVEDPCRTGWTATGCTSGALGAWTFGRLMASMSGNTDITSDAAKSFVNQWLRSWLSVQSVGTDPVAVRPLIGPVLLFRWLAASSCTSPAQTVRDPAQWMNALQACKLNLQAAPFRLSAIVNRIDLDGRDYSGTNGAPGELRFVFGAINTATQAPVNAAVILEYRLPNTAPPFVWAQWFHNLSSVAFGTSFASQLQSITDLVVTTNAQPGGPNGGSSIGQVRTNENAFDGSPSQQWEFRQFALPCATGSCQIAQVPVSQTPATSANNGGSLTMFLTANQTDISTSHHVVPASMLGGSSLSFNRTNAVIWNTADDTINGGYMLVNPSDPVFSYNVRHNFAFSTCNGCHYLETLNQNQNFHVAPRALGVKAQLSSFLSRSLAPDPARPGYPSDILEVPDPNPDSYDVINGTSYYFQYNEIWRRSCEIRRVLAGIQAPFTTPTGHN